jgi:hypothetical protein
LRLNGRFGSSVTGALGAGVAGGASPNAGGALPKSLATGAGVGVGVATGAGVGAGGGVQVCCGTSGEGVIHCGCAGTLTSGAVPTPEIFPLLSPRSFLYHV